MMLLEGEPVKAVAKALGYSDAYAFSKQFKRFCGSLPLRLRAKPAAKALTAKEPDSFGIPLGCPAP